METCPRCGYRDVHDVTELLQTLRTKARRAGISNVRLGDLIGVHHNTVWRWFHGYVTPYPGQIEAIQRVSDSIL